MKFEIGRTYKYVNVTDIEPGMVLVDGDTFKVVSVDEDGDARGYATYNGDYGIWWLATAAYLRDGTVINDDSLEYLQGREAELTKELKSVKDGILALTPRHKFTITPTNLLAIQVARDTTPGVVYEGTFHPEGEYPQNSYCFKDDVGDEVTLPVDQTTKAEHDS